MCVCSDSIANYISTFLCYMCSVRKLKKKEEVDAVLYLEW